MKPCHGSSSGSYDVIIPWQADYENAGQKLTVIKRGIWRGAVDKKTAYILTIEEPADLR